MVPSLKGILHMIFSFFQKYARKIFRNLKKNAENGFLRRLMAKVFFLSCSKRPGRMALPPASADRVAFFRFEV